MSTFFLACSVALTVLFAWSALAKLADPGRWLGALDVYRFGSTTPVVALLAPAAEFGVVALFLAGATQIASAATLALVALFSLAILRARSQTTSNRLPCGCFGKTTEHDYRVMLLRNGLVAALAGALLVGSADVHLLDKVGTAEAVPVLVTVATVAVGTWVVAQYLHATRPKR